MAKTASQNCINMNESYRKCAKCGHNASEVPKVALYRFPKPGILNVKRCEAWAKYCFPNEPWASPAYQQKLYSRHMMLCSTHFHIYSFIDFDKRRLHRHAVPDDECLKEPAECLIKTVQSDLNAPHHLSIDCPNETLNGIDDTLLTATGNDSREVPVVSQEGQGVSKEDPGVDKQKPDVIEEAPIESDCFRPPSPEVDDDEASEQTQELPVICENCNGSVVGARFACVSCSGRVVCGACVLGPAHPHCYVLRVPPGRPRAEVVAVLRAVRTALDMSMFADQLAEPLAGYHDQCDIKSESEDVVEDLEMEVAGSEVGDGDPSDPLAGTTAGYSKGPAAVQSIKEDAVMKEMKADTLRMQTDDSETDTDTNYDVEYLEPDHESLDDIISDTKIGVTEKDTKVTEHAYMSQTKQMLTKRVPILPQKTQAKNYVPIVVKTITNARILLPNREPQKGATFVTIDRLPVGPISETKYNAAPPTVVANDKKYKIISVIPQEAQAGLKVSPVSRQTIKLDQKTLKPIVSTPTFGHTIIKIDNEILKQPNIVLNRLEDCNVSNAARVATKRKIVLGAHSRPLKISFTKTPS